MSEQELLLGGLTSKERQEMAKILNVEYGLEALREVAKHGKVPNYKHLTKVELCYGIAKYFKFSWNDPSELDVLNESYRNACANISPIEVAEPLGVQVRNRTNAQICRDLWTTLAVEGDYFGRKLWLLTCSEHLDAGRFNALPNIESVFNNAISDDDANAIQRLLDLGAYPNSPAKFAAFKGKSDLVEIFINDGANREDVAVYAALNGHIELARRYSNDPFQLLIKVKASLSSQLQKFKTKKKLQELLTRTSRIIESVKNTTNFSRKSTILADFDFFKKQVGHKLGSLMTRLAIQESTGHPRKKRQSILMNSPPARQSKRPKGKSGAKRTVTTKRKR